MIIHIDTTLSKHSYFFNNGFDKRILNRMTVQQYKEFCHNTNKYKYKHMIFIIIIHLYSQGYGNFGIVKFEQKLNFIPTDLITLSKRIETVNFVPQMCLTINDEFTKFINIIATINFINKYNKIINNKARCLIESNDNNMKPLYDFIFKNKKTNNKLIYRTKRNIFNNSPCLPPIYYDLNDLLQYVNNKINKKIYYNMIYYTYDNQWMIK